MKKTLLVIFLLCATLAYGQDAVTSGRVTDERNEPLIGVSIVQQGSGKGATTDANGNYSVSAPSGEVLTFSYVGYTTVEYKATGGRLDVTLQPDSRQLDDVVVIGYGIQRKSSVTGAISTVKAEDMVNRTITRPEQALQGKTAGVQIVQTSGAPGAAPQVRVRGYSSNASSSPLFVVDGVRMSNIGGIDPNDIASMEVLKDAASAAIYGAEAGNGVILISTKRGRAGFSRISYDFQYSWQSLARVPKMLNAEQYIDYMTEGGFIPLTDIMTNWDARTNTSWVDETFETALMQRHNVAFEGGNDRGTYYLSLSYLDNNGIVKGDKDVYERLTATVNADYKIKPWLKVGTNNMVEKYDARSVSENSEYGSLLAAVLQMDPLTPSVYAPGDLPANMINAQKNGHKLLTDADGNYYSVSRFYESEQVHPMIMRDRTTSKNGGFNINGAVFADLTPVEGLTFTSRFGYRFSGSNSSSYDHPYYGNATQSRSYATVGATTSTSIYYQWENFANYLRSFGKHEVNAMVGMSFQKAQSNYTNGSLTANGEHAILKDNPLFGWLNYASASATRNVGGEETFTTKNSYFGRVSYNYDNRYFLQASLRADAADLAYLPKSNRWGYFPAVSAGWDISNEKFMTSTHGWLSQLKLRASWGQNGSLAALGGYVYSTDMSSAGNYPFVGGNNYILGARPATMGNDELRWETSEQFDIGVDARFFNNRLSLSADYYEKRTKDLLVNGTTPSLSIGGTASAINAGNVLNKGFELELGWQDRRGDFRYGVNAVMATLNNKVTYLDKSLTRIEGARFHTYGISYFEQGHPVYYFRGYKLDGIDSATGNPVFQDTNDDDVINEDDKVAIGSAIPDFTYGITLTAGWKGLDLVVFGTGSMGNDIFNGINRPDYPKSNKLKEIWYDDRWTPTNTGGTKPRAGASDLDKYAVSDAMIFNGSFFKIKQIQLGYTLPEKWTRKIFVSHLRVYVSLDDFFIFTKYPGFDPEASAGSAISSMGVDKGAYPSSRKTVIGLNITF
uniref:Putative TonB-dependent receptor family protein n=1 Tax=termite gut metagenome TaxID=433724 RepID=S0DFS7_9ZZZZ